MQYKLINEENTQGSALYRVLRNRGIEDPYHYLNTTDEDIIDPVTIHNMRDAARKLMQHVAAEHDIFINIDSDCDGYTSAAFLVNYLYHMFPSFSTSHITWGTHTNKSHGLLMDQILAKKPQLVICPDAGSEEYEKHKELVKNKIDLIIIDHHNANHYSEFGTVINNQLDGGYPTKSLSGVGMVYKFCSYFDQLRETSYADELLDIAALGIIADVMPLKDYETRRIIDKGLSNIENPFIKAMIAKNEYSLKGKVTPTGLAWYVAPAVNAVTRVGTQKEKEILFESFLNHKAYTLIPSTKRGHKVGDTETVVEQACRICNNAKNRQNKVRDALVESIDFQIKNEHLLDNKILFVKIDEPTEDSRTLTGLIANKLMSTYGHPVMVLNKTFDEETGELTWSGSGRNNSSAGVESLQQLAENSGYFTLAQGHDNALGLSIPDSNVEKFLIYSNTLLKDCNFTPIYNVDIEFYANKIDKADILELADASNVWGQEVDEPLVAIKNVSITKDNLNLFGSTLKISLPDNISIVKFKSSQDEFDALNPGEGCIIIDVVGRCMRNTGWDNEPQIILEDYEIVRKQEYYF